MAGCCDDVTMNAYLLAGGYEYDGRQISTVSAADVTKAVELVLRHDAAAVVVCGVHAPVNPAQELDFATQLKTELQRKAPGMVGEQANCPPAGNNRV